MHDKNFVHRDLKPENILLNIEKNNKGKEIMVPKIADFGLSAEFKLCIYLDYNDVKGRLGTILYMAPE